VFSQIEVAGGVPSYGSPWQHETV